MLLFERHGFPVVNALLVIDRGPLDVGDAGGMQVGRTMYLYGRGGSEEVVDRLSEEWRQSGIRFGMGQTGAGVWVSVLGPAKEIDKCLTTLQTLSFHARLSPDEYDRRTAEWETRAKLGGMSMESAQRLVLFGKDHPLGFPGWGRDPFAFHSATSLHRRLFQPSHATIVVVGDVTPENLEPIAQAAFAPWTSGESLEKRQDPSPPVRGPRVSSFRQGFSQMHAAVFALGPPPHDEGMVAFALATEVLSGGHSSGLFEQLREEKGATYSLWAGVRAERTTSWTTLASSYDKEKAVDGVRAVLQAVKSLRDGEVKGEDVAAARERLVAAWRERMATVAGAAGEYGTAVLLGADLDRARDFPSYVARVNREEVVRIANRYLDANALHVVFAGDDRLLDVHSLDMGGATKLEVGRSE
jgi:zinc protease